MVRPTKLISEGAAHRLCAENANQPGTSQWVSSNEAGCGPLKWPKLLPILPLAQFKQSLPKWWPHVLKRTLSRVSIGLS